MRNSPRFYTDQEIDWLKENYPIFGSKHCASILQVSLEQLRNKVKNLKLNKIDRVDVEQFKKIETKEISYILGLMWADGHIHKNKRHISVSIVNDDMMYLNHIFMTTGDWNYNIINLDKYGYKHQGRINIGNVKLHKILSDYGFKEKSTISPTKLLECIPKNLHHYFLRGLIDGDGCFYINKKYHTYQFSISSTINQNWDYMINICKDLNINYRIDISNKVKSKSSLFRVCRKKDVIIIGDYIYQDFSFGLNRKYQKFLEIKNS